MLPLVLYVHGGPTARDEWVYDPVVQLLANRGYAVLQVNFRGSVGFGNAFQRAGDGQIGVGAMQNDLTDAVRWAVREGIADAGKIGIAGASFGGYATLAGLAFTPELYACGASVCGPANIKTLLQSIPAYLGPLKSLFGRIFGDAEGDDVYNRRVSPLFHVERIRAPLFVAQGANDPRCPMAESDRLVQAMRDRGLPVLYAVYPDEGHGFKRPENRMDYYGRLEEFLAGPLGGRCEPRREVRGASVELR
jgi:dipeptidyl aminopeptidase/acylaminoacyl peptidase